MSDENIEVQRIRLEVLEMARSLLEQEYYNSREVALSEYNCKVGTENQIPVPENLPKFPTVAKIMSLAEKLNAFVTNSAKQ